MTSPPYPGVYDYLSTAREERAKLGSFDGAAEALVMGLKGNPSGRDGWPDEWKSNNEMGARKALRRRATEFAGTWQSDHEAWLRAVAAAGARRAAIVIGDGPGVDALESTRAAAAASGWRLAAVRRSSRACRSKSGGREPPDGARDPARRRVVVG